MAEVLNLAPCTMLSQGNPSGDCCFSPGRSEKPKRHSQAPCLQVEAARRALSPTGRSHGGASPASALKCAKLQALTTPTQYARVGLGEPNEVPWNCTYCVEPAMRICVSHLLGHQVAECDANTTNAAIMLVSLVVRLDGCSGIAIFHQVSW